MMPPWDYMNAERCEIMWTDKTSRFHQLWSESGWRVRRRGDAACWGDDGAKYFDDAWWGRSCEKRNWYAGKARTVPALGTVLLSVHSYPPRRVPCVWYRHAGGGGGRRAERGPRAARRARPAAPRRHDAAHDVALVW